jgi:hypothetical protein
MTGGDALMRSARRVWLPTWPLWTLLIFGSLAVLRLAPADYRAAAAAPILFMAPGSLTVGAAFGARHGPKGAVFVCLAALLGAAWAVFASLALYALNIRITPDSTFRCLLIVSAALAIVAQARLLFERPARGRRAVRRHETVDTDLSDTEIRAVGVPVAANRTPFYSLAAVAAGIGLLAGGVFAYDHLSHPAPVGYTWMAWTGKPIKGTMSVSGGTELHFEIVHHQSGSTTFHLAAEWFGKATQPLAKPLTFSMGQNQTFQGTLYVPALPTGCIHRIYRIVMTLTASHQTDPLTKKPQTWSIDADVQDQKTMACPPSRPGHHGRHKVHTT